MKSKKLDSQTDKPWRDPDSLFYNTKFLENLFSTKRGKHA